MNLGDLFGGFTYNSPQMPGYWADQNIQGQYANSMAAQQNCLMANAYNQMFYTSHTIRETLPVKAEPLGDCDGCGAPMKRYRSCCEYCRRPS